MAATLSTPTEGAETAVEPTASTDEDDDDGSDDGTEQAELTELELAELAEMAQSNLTEMGQSAEEMVRTLNALWNNGGPTSHACNAPLRGGKFTFW